MTNEQNRIKDRVELMTDEDREFSTLLNFNHLYNYAEERLYRFIDFLSGDVDMHKKAIGDALFSEIETLLDEAEKLAGIPYKGSRSV